MHVLRPLCTNAELEMRFGCSSISYLDFGELVGFLFVLLNIEFYHGLAGSEDPKASASACLSVCLSVCVSVCL